MRYSAVGCMALALSFGSKDTLVVKLLGGRVQCRVARAVAVVLVVMLSKAA